MMVHEHAVTKLWLGFYNFLLAAIVLHWFSEFLIRKSSLAGESIYKPSCSYMS